MVAAAVVVVFAPCAVGICAFGMNYLSLCSLFRFACSSSSLSRALAALLRAIWRHFSQGQIRNVYAVRSKGATVAIMGFCAHVIRRSTIRTPVSWSTSTYQCLFSQALSVYSANLLIIGFVLPLPLRYCVRFSAALLSLLPHPFLLPAQETGLFLLL